MKSTVYCVCRLSGTHQPILSVVLPESVWNDSQLDEGGQRVCGQGVVSLPKLLLPPRQTSQASPSSVRNPGSSYNGIVACQVVLEVREIGLSWPAAQTIHGDARCHLRDTQSYERQEQGGTHSICKDVPGQACQCRHSELRTPL